MLNVQNRNNPHRVRLPNQISLTPSFDYAWAGVGIPISYNTYSGFKAGLGARLGPLTIGVTDFAQGELGDIVYVEVETEGESLGKEEVFGSVEAVKTVSDLFMPVSGEITEFNSDLEANPEVVNSDPYGKGWMVKVKVSDASQWEDLLDSDAYAKLIGA